MERILDKINIGSTVVSSGRIFTITGQKSELEWEWEHADGSSGIFTFQEDQLEDSSFVIIS